METGSLATPGLRVTAAQWKDELTVLIVNDAAAGNAITVRMPGGGKKSLASYHYFESDRPVDRDGYPIPKEMLKADLEQGVKIELPSRGVMLLTTASPH